MTKEGWVEKAEAKHGVGRYDYSNAHYVRAKDKVTIRCYTHGDFVQTACSHTQGVGCPDCGREAISKSRTKGLATFLSEAQQIHKGKYSYTKVIWVNAGTKITVTCNTHGDFSILPKTHTGKGAQGCKACTQEKWSKDRKGTTQDFIQKSTGIYGTQFDYTYTTYIGWGTPIKLICRTHNTSFQVAPQYHFKAGGCPICAKHRRKAATSTTFSEFLTRARNKHGDIYEYDENSYGGIAKPLNICCQTHGWFSQPGYVHLRAKVGCPNCTDRIPLEHTEVARRIFELHGESLDYSLMNFQNTHTPLMLRCIKHDHIYESLLHNLLKDNKGNGCRVCALESASEANSITFEEFKERANKVYGGVYAYKNYINMTSLVTCTCKNHGDFSQIANYHLKGYGCPRCNINKIENEIVLYLRSLNIVVEQSNRSLIRSKNGTPMELDIYLPELCLAIEVDGVLWHSERYGKNQQYHIYKTTECEKQGIQLLHIFDDEYNLHKETIQAKLAHICGQSAATRIGARSCTLQEISNKDYQDFVNTHHLQGYAPSSVRVGVYSDKKELIAVAGFSKPRSIFKRSSPPDEEWELVRFATHKDYHCIGGLGKMLAWFRGHIPFKTLITYADRRWSTGRCYDAVGFTKAGATDPGYWYGDKKGNRHHRYTFAKHKLPKLLDTFDIALTEVENMAIAGYFRVWDCGNLKYTLTK